MCTNSIVIRSNKYAYIIQSICYRYIQNICKYIKIPMCKSTYNISKYQTTIPANIQYQTVERYLNQYKRAGKFLQTSSALAQGGPDYPRAFCTCALPLSVRCRGRFHTNLRCPTISRYIRGFEPPNRYITNRRFATWLPTHRLEPSSKPFEHIVGKIP